RRRVPRGSALRVVVVQTPQKAGRLALSSQKRRNLVSYSRGREIVAGTLRPASLFHEEKSSIQERARRRSHVRPRTRMGRPSLPDALWILTRPRAPHDARWTRQAPLPLVSAPVVRRTSPPAAHPRSASTPPSLHPPPERISPDPDALLRTLAKRILCSASFSPGNTRARPRTSSRKVKRILVLFANIATTASLAAGHVPTRVRPARARSCAGA